MTCFDRDKDSQRLWAYFEKQRNVLMLAPRRIGKTVLLNRLRDESEQKGYRAIVLDVEGFHDEKAFFQQMCALIQEELSFGTELLTAFTGKLRQVLKRTENANDWRQLLLHTDWNQFAQHLLAHLDKDEQPWLILVDELPLFVLDLIQASDVKHAHEFLYTLRGFRQKYRNIRWLYAGSIGLDSIARRFSIEGALNDLTVYSLQPFAPDTARDFLQHVAADNLCQFDTVALDSLIGRVHWLAPYYLERVAEEACNYANADKIIFPDAVDQACAAMLALDKRTYWSTWREHLDRNFQDPEKTLLFTILKIIAHAPQDQVSVDTLLTSLTHIGISHDDLRAGVDTLVADGFLDTSANGSRYQFRMGLLHEWWLKYVAPVTPPAQQGV